MAGGHTDAREGRHVARGGWRVKGPWVSGPWLEYWGCNAKALPRSTFYTRFSPLFLPCGTVPSKISSCRRCGSTVGVG